MSAGQTHPVDLTSEFYVARPPGMWHWLKWKLRGWHSWQIRFHETYFHLRQGYQCDDISFSNIDQITRSRKDDILLKIDGGKLYFLFCDKRQLDIDELLSAFADARHQALIRQIKSLLEGVRLPAQTPFDDSKYVRNHEYDIWVESLPDFAPFEEALKLQALLGADGQPLSASSDSADTGTTASIDAWRDQLVEYAKLRSRASQEYRREFNDEFITAEMRLWKDFFDDIESQPLTDEQRRAAIEMEDRNLLVAAAGSGKTSVVVGKVGYAVKSDFCRPEEILVLAFNGDAVEELRKRIGDRLGSAAEGVNYFTFHGLGLHLIGEATGNKPPVADWTTNLGESSASNDHWQELIGELQRTDSAFARAYWKLWLLFGAEMKPQHQFNSINDYEDYVSQAGRQLRDDKGSFRIQTLQGDQVRSLEELHIANWLFWRKINYKYECNYPHAEASGKYRTYKPDFYYPDADLYHEHLALNENGEPPKFFSDDYVERVKYKRELHQDKGTKLIETTSAMVPRGTLLDELQAKLEAHGIDCSQERPLVEIEEAIGEHKITDILGLFQSFIAHWEESGIDLEALRAKAAKLQGYANKRADAFLAVVAPIKDAYEAKLGQANEIDFGGMIQKAAEHLIQLRASSPYKLILVDEFQDISRSRARLVKAMLEQQPGSVLFAVGDDWQSIYRFAGSDISIMSNFESEFGFSARNDLTLTFRSNQAIADVATKFISINPQQLQKQVRASRPTTDASVEISYCREDLVEKEIEKELLSICGVAGKEDTKQSVYILGRYNLKEPDNLADMKLKYDSWMELEFSTIHGAKGLEADFVIVLGMNAGKFGFPNSRSNDSLMSLVLPQPENFEFAEERRLLYVALTRAKRRVLLLVPGTRPSVFVDNLLEMGDERIRAKNKPVPLPGCPDCKREMVIRQRKIDGVKFLGCRSYPACTGNRNYGE